MRTIRFASLFCLLALSCFLAVANDSAHADGTVLTDANARTQWTDAVQDMFVVEEDLNSLIDSLGSPVSDSGNFEFLQDPQTRLWGELSGSTELAENFSALFGGSFRNPEEVVTLGPVLAKSFIGEDSSIILNFEDNGLDPLSGFLIPSLILPEDFNNDSSERTLTFRIYDGEIRVEEFTVVGEEENTVESLNRQEARPFFVGWINTDGVNVTRIEISGTTTTEEGSDDSIILLDDIRFAFAELASPAETCFDLLTDVADNVAELLLTSDGRDAAYLRGALNCLRWSQSDFFWEQPSGDRLSIYGSSVFTGAAYTVSYLQRVDDPQADVIVDQLLDVLECIVDNEIAYAIENDGRESFIERAEDFAELGEIIDDDFDNQLVATLAYRLAWVHAYYSTY